MLSARRVAARHEDGNAILEFVMLTSLFLIPLTYLILAVFQVQGAAYGVTEGAREAGRVFVQADSLAAAYPQSCTAATVALKDQGAATSVADCATQLHMSCVADQPCAVQLTPGTTIRAHLQLAVHLPFLPASVFGIPLTIRVSATHDEVVDEFRAVG